MDILIYPRNELIFDKNKQKSIFLNNNAIKKIVFFIKTTCPYAYTIIPYLGIIEPKGEQVIIISIRNQLKINKNPRLKLEFYEIPNINNLLEKDIKLILKSKQFEPINIKYLNIIFSNQNINYLENMFKSSPKLKENNKIINNKINLFEKIGIIIVFLLILIKMFFYYYFT